MIEMIKEKSENYKLQKRVRELEKENEEWKNKYYKRVEDICDIFKQNESLKKTAKFYKEHRDKLRKELKEMENKK